MERPDGPFVRWQEEEVCDRRTSIDSRGGNFEKLLKREAGEKLGPLDARAKVVTHFQQAIIEEATTWSTPKPRHVFPFHPPPTFLVKLFFDSFFSSRGKMSFHPSPNFELPLFEFRNG